METFHYPAPFGPLAVHCDGERVCGVRFLPELPAPAAQSVFARRASHELDLYFANPRHVFTLPIALQGTEFQQRLWRALLSIPVGEVRRYGDLSAMLDSSARAIGGACRSNPLPLIVPCHRVVSASGDGGFAGAIDGPLLAIKRWLLRHEGAPLAPLQGQLAGLFSVAPER